MVAGVAGGNGEGGQALDIKRVSPRVTSGDLVVALSVLLLVLSGWGLKMLHDDRLTSTEIDAVSVSYPSGWIRLPAQEPEVMHAISDDNGQSAVILTAQDTGQKDIRLAIASGAGNPASGETAYTQLGNTEATLNGNPAVRSDYAYVKTVVGGSTAPRVMKGRQVAWIKDGTLYALAAEGPDDHWGDTRETFDRIEEKVSS